MYPGISKQWNGKATQSTPASLDPLLQQLVLVLEASVSTPSFSGYEGVPQGGIHFCGEHTSQDFQGFMEGGASEGVRAGEEVLAAI